MNEPTIRILNEIADAELLKEAWNFAADAPEWFREVQSSHKETLENFLTGAEKELLVGVFVENIITAVVRFVPQKAGIYELHLLARRGTDWQTLADSCASIRDYVFGHGLTKLGGWLPRANRSIARLYRALGFEYQGLRCWQGKIHGRAAEWRYYFIDAERFFNIK